MIEGFVASTNIFRARFFEGVGQPSKIKGHENHFKPSLGEFSLRAPIKDNCLPHLISEDACF
jgi:hypothetical protein